MAIGDAELIRSAKEGDSLAFESFVRRHDRGIRALTARLLGDTWSEDVLQETYVKAFRALPSVRVDPDRLSGWLYRIAYRTAVDELRRHSRKRVVYLDAMGDADVASLSMSPSQADQAVIRMELEAALDGLSLEQRATVILIDQLGFDYATAARILEIPRGTVASRVSEARRNLRRILVSPDGEPGSQIR